MFLGLKILLSVLKDKKMCLVKSAFETLEKNILSVFFKSTLGVFFLEKYFKLKFLDIPKIPIYLSLNIYLLFLKTSIHFI